MYKITKLTLQVHLPHTASLPFIQQDRQHSKSLDQLYHSLKLRSTKDNMAKLQYLVGLLFASSALGSPWSKDAKRGAPHGPGGYGGDDSWSSSSSPPSYGGSGWGTTCEASTYTLPPTTQYLTSTCTETITSSLPGTTVWATPTTITDYETTTLPGKLFPHRSSKICEADLCRNNNNLDMLRNTSTRYHQQHQD